MILANINLGTGPSAGDGDPLRTAFGIINNNFAQLQINVNSLSNSVTTVAGRTGNIILTTQDIINFNTNQFANITYVTAANLGMKGYADAITTAWTANAAMQSDLINAITSYSNVLVADYLPTYSGNLGGNKNGFSIGYLEMPQVAAGNVIFSQNDSGKHYYSTTSSPTTLTIPSDANVVFPLGSTITIINQGIGNIFLDIQPAVNLYFAGNAASSTRILTTYGVSSLVKVATNTWFINGTGVV